MASAGGEAGSLDAAPQAFARWELVWPETGKMPLGSCPCQLGAWPAGLANEFARVFLRPAAPKHSRRRQAAAKSFSEKKKFFGGDLAAASKRSLQNKIFVLFLFSRFKTILALIVVVLFGLGFRRDHVREESSL
jgi:hypothetical protein